MGWSGQTITVVTNVVPSLVMVIAFSNAIHLLLAVRRERMAGLDASDAVRQAVIAVGPATMMTALTTAVALATLTIVDRPAIASFGLIAAFGALAACAIVLLLVPALSRLLLGPADAQAERLRATRGLSGLVSRASAATARLVTARPALLVGVSIALLALCGTLYALNAPQFRYSANLPTGSQVADAARTLDEKLSGSGDFEVLVTLPPDAPALSAQTLEIAAAVHEALRAQPQFRAVWSLDEVARWYRSQGRGTRELIAEMRDDRHRHLRAPDQPRARPDAGQRLPAGPGSR